MLQQYSRQLTSSRVKRILLIGSGLMAEAVVDQLLKRQENFIIIASALEKEAKSLASRKQRCEGHFLDVTQSDPLRKYVTDSDIVIAYIPPQFIVPIAKMCAEVGRSMVTSQYAFPEIKQLENIIKSKGLIFLNEIGLDPGIDHLATIKVRDEVHAKGGKIIEYESWCGGVPSPEFCDNPFGYKFSWSPFAAIRNINNDAKFLDENKEKYISGKDLLYSTEIIHVNPALQMEGYPNRDSIPYKEFYGLKDCQKLVRGTLRYQGHCLLMAAMKSIGLASEEIIQKELTWFEYLNQNLKNVPNQQNHINQQDFFKISNNINSNDFNQEQIMVLLNKVINQIFQHQYFEQKNYVFKQDFAKRVVEALVWMKVFSKLEKVIPNVSHVHNFAAHLQKYMNYNDGETDLVAMQHIFRITYPGDPKIYVKKSTMVKIGEKNGKSAMAITVGVPTAVATQCILDGQIKETGVHIPNMKSINEPIMKELEKLNIYCVETDC